MVIFPISNGVFLLQNAILEQVEMHTPPQRKQDARVN